MATVFVGLSGGVDSAVAAALLQRAGHTVTGVFIKIWQPEFTECTWREDRLDAMRSAAALGIPFREIDLSTEYKRTVVDDMLATYSAGRTPNPDVLCNRYIKFGSFAEWAYREGAEKIATGHHARVKEDDGGYALLRAVDRSKDQSYFLHQLGHDDLNRTLFPIGEYKKEDVRRMAREYNLPVADRPDSQGLCFVGAVDMREFLKRYVDVGVGKVLDEGGHEIGEHDGAFLYTRGQRHGFRIETSGAQNATIPRYVKDVDVVSNTITVSGNAHVLERKNITTMPAHWIRTEPILPGTFLVQTRYHEEVVPASITKSENGLNVALQHGKIFSAGQSLVIYAGDECLGGAVIIE